MRALCVGRHQYLSEHLARYFGELGVETASAVGLDGAAAVARGWLPDVVLCDYTVLAALPLDAWEHDEALARTPIVAISLTRTPDEASLDEVNGIAGLLYLPALSASEALSLVTAAVRGRSRPAGVVAPPDVLPAWPASTVSATT
jgi:CheY-like chemotaxis protein